MDFGFSGGGSLCLGFSGDSGFGFGLGLGLGDLVWHGWLSLFGSGLGVNLGLVFL